MPAAKSFAAAVVALPYRFRFGRLGARARLFPPLLISGGRRIELGDDVRVESYVALSAGPKGRIVIGSHCELRPFAQLEADSGFIVLGDRCSVNQFCLLNGFGGITMGNDVRIAAHSVILSSSHRYDDLRVSMRDQGVTRKETVIGDDVWLGARATVLGGVHVGSHSIIAAGAVVLKDVPEYAVMAGVPARLVRRR